MSKQMWRPGNMLYPVPAVMVSCQRPGEKPNIVTVAWVGTVCSDPAMLSISVRKERHSHDIIKETKEFVVNLTTKDLAYATDWCGVRSGRDFDKFDKMHLTPFKSNKVACPGIEQSPVNIECKVKQFIPLGSHDLFIAEVMCVDVDEKYLDDKGRFDMKTIDPIAYLHGEYYTLGKKLGKFGYSVVKKGNISKSALSAIDKSNKKNTDSRKSVESDNNHDNRRKSDVRKSFGQRKATDTAASRKKSVRTGRAPKSGRR